MKKSLTLIPALATALLIAGCETGHDKGPYLAQTPKTPAYENTEQFVLLDPEVQHCVTRGNINERTLEDGRLEVIAQVRNRENHRIEVQANCVFKDQNGFSVGDETPFQTLIITENATEQVRFVSSSNQAHKYTIRVRQAH
jgi:uncharacterized protein YcfL